MALFQSTWDTRTGTAALISTPSTKNATDKSKSSGKKRKSEDGSVGAGPSIDLDSLMKKMAGVGGGAGKGTKGKGKERVGKNTIEGKAGERKKLKVDGEEGKAKTTKKDRTNEKERKGNSESGEPTAKPSSPTKTTSQSTPAAQPSPDSKPRGEKRKGDQEVAPKSKKQKKREQKQVEGGQALKGVSEKEKPDPGAGMGALTALQSSMKSNLEGARFR